MLQHFLLEQCSSIASAIILLLTFCIKCSPLFVINLPRARVQRPYNLQHNRDLQTI